MKRLNLLLVVALLGLVPALACNSPTAGPAEPPAAETAAEEAAPEAEPAATTASEAAPASETAAGETTPPSEPKRKFVPPIRGIAEIGYTRPTTKVVNDEVLTTIRVRNMSTGAIAGLRVDEFWWDAQGNPLPGDTQRLRQPLLPGEETTFELRVPRNPRMNRNNYNFTHANGTIKATLVPKL